jgi:outer membrane protein assembly factor BamB
MILSPDGSKLYTSGQSEDQDPVWLSLDWEATLFALDAQTGTEFWVGTYPAPTFGDAMGNAVAINPTGTQVFLTGEAGQVLFVRSLDATSGAVSWTTHFELSSLFAAAPGTSRGTSVMVAPSGSEVYVTGRASSLPTVPGSEPLTLEACRLQPATSCGPH